MAWLSHTLAFFLSFIRIHHVYHDGPGALGSRGKQSHCPLLPLQAQRAPGLDRPRDGFVHHPTRPPIPLSIHPSTSPCHCHAMALGAVIAQKFPCPTTPSLFCCPPSLLHCLTRLGFLAKMSRPVAMTRHLPAHPCSSPTAPFGLVFELNRFESPRIKPGQFPVYTSPSLPSHTNWGKDFFVSSRVPLPIRSAKRQNKTLLLILYTHLGDGILREGRCA